MKTPPIRALAAALALGVAATLAWQAEAGRELVRFPEDYAEGVRYAVVPRGGIRQEIFTSREAIEAVRNNQPLPSGTVITLVDHRGGEIFRYVVMEKRAGWGAGYPPDIRNGEWEFQAFNADRTVNESEDVGRCFACHRSREGQDFVFTLDQMRSVP